MLKQKLMEMELESVSEISEIPIAPVANVGLKAGLVAVEIEIPDDRIEQAAPEDLTDWIESLTEDEIDGLVDPYGYNLAEAEDW